MTKFSISPTGLFSRVKFQIIILFTLLLSQNCKASNFYWVGGRGSWSDYANHWATTSGGLIFHIQTPGPNDNVFFDANSFPSAGDTVKIDSTLIYCKDMTWTGVLNNPLLNFSTGTLKIYGSLTLAPNMMFGSYLSYGIVSFESTTTGKTITTAGITCNASFGFNGIGGSWSLNDTLTLNMYNAGIGIYQGSFSTNNFPVRSSSFIISTSGTVDLGSSLINCGGSFNDNSPGIVIASATTINTSTFYGYSGRVYHDVNCSSVNGNNSIFNDVTCYSFGGGHIAHNVLFLAAGNIDGNNTIHKATFLNGNVYIDDNSSFDSLVFNAAVYSVTLESATTQTINNALLLNGSCTNWVSFHSDLLGTQATISKSSGAVIASYLLLNDINVTGGATFTANNSINMGNATGWTINAPAAQNLYWVGGNGLWNDSSHWSFSSGGSGGACLPSPNDNVFFDANSFSSAGDTVRINVPQVYCNDMTWTGVLNNPLLNFSTGTLKIYGSLTLAPNMMFGIGSYSSLVFFESTSTGKTITTAGTYCNASFRFNGIGGSWSLNDTLTLNTAYAGIGISQGSFSTNNFPVSCSAFNIYTTGTVDLGSSLINCGGGFTDNSTGTVIASATTINTSTFYGYSGRVYNDVNCSSVNGNNSIFNDVTCYSFGGGHTAHNVLFLSGGYITGNNTIHKAIFLNGDVNINGNSSFDSLMFDNPGNTIRLSSGTTQTVNDYLSANPLPGFPILLHSSTLGSQATISKSIGTVCLNYFLIQDINATGGAQFYAGDYSTDLGNNTGWSFTSCAPAISNVWPGDANYDLACNNLDILNIGVAYGDTGYTRAGASLAWVAQPGLDWFSQFLSGVNAKHADCDGNGLVDASDTLAVSLNYGQTHPPRLSSFITTQSGPPLYFEIPATNLTPGSYVSIPIKFGDASTQVNNLYGIAFTVNYDASFIVPGSVSITYANSWLIPAGNYIHLEKDFYSSGKTEMALCRTNHQNVSGYGTIALLNFTVANNASGLLQLSFNDVKAISANEIDVPYNSVPATIVTGVENINDADYYTIYPNPAQDKIYFSGKSEKITQVEVFDSRGQKVISANGIKNKRLEIAQLEKGVYLLRTTMTDSKIFITKFMKE